MTQTETLTARIDEQLKATEGHTAGPWHVSDRVGEQVIVRTASGQGVATSLNRDEDHPDAALIASAPILRALLVEARAQIAAQAEALAAVRGALGTVLDEAYDGQHSYRVDLSTLRAAYETLGARQ
jgi:hypothetical protein